MKTKLTILSIVFLLITSSGFAQKDPQSIISGKVSISKYHDRSELDQMVKGDLLSLYNERIEVIVKILPNIAFATKPGVTMSSLGIPDTKDNRKALEENIQASNTYFDSTIEFQNKVLPYSDKSNLISAILFYEETLKSLHTYSEFNKY
ncbi:hypothetical protein LX77_00683 [Gelidibacter algens]|jgi:hypothetical protein|uniref:Uncharacterized protein n=1 Tax=Gelidibacter algens TaxID=49280 RepID=A0A1A7R822_9FLAO|nr:hypothetical protein [Gelidibacter algens]OBX26892.1 hypothetical protein A9996_02145 [Gelidibacter algens]RAJ26434.1 hypothetical protein LX77_00683 [Gelidibacter algens]